MVVDGVADDLPQMVGLDEAGDVVFFDETSVQKSMEEISAARPVISDLLS